MRARAGLNAATDDLVQCLFRLMSQRSKEGHRVDWDALSRGAETCEGINTMMRKVWRHLEPHASRCLPPFPSRQARTASHTRSRMTRHACSIGSPP